MKNLIQKQSGFTLIEIMVAVGLLGGLSLAGAQLFKTQNSAQKDVEANYEVTTIVNQIKSILSSPDQCLATLTPNVDPNNDALPGKQFLNRWDSSTNSYKPTMYTAADPSYNSNTNRAIAEHPGGITILKYYIKKPSSGYGSFETNLMVDFSKGQGKIRQTVTKLIKLIYTVDGSGKINSCFAFNAGTDSIWKPSPSNGANIYYSGGLVGIGTANPVTNLDIEAASGGTSIQIGSNGTGSSDQSVLQFETLGGAGSMTAGGHKGWQMYGRGNAYTGFGFESNDLGLAYWDGSAWNTAYVVDSGTRYVGIGEANPQFRLVARQDVAGHSIALNVDNRVNYSTYPQTAGMSFSLSESESANAATRIMGIIRAGNVWAGTSERGYMSFWTRGASSVLAEGMRIDWNGWVGIGITAPAQPLHVGGGAQIGAPGLGLNATGDPFLFHESNNNTDPVLIRRENAGNDNSHMRFVAGDNYNPSSSDGDGFYFGDNLNTGAVILANGQAGFGTSTPRSRLDVVGGIRASKGNSSGDATNAGYSFEADGDTGMFAVGGVASGSSDIVFNSDNIERMRLAYSGNVGIGVASPAQKLHVNGTVKSSTAGLTSMPSGWNVGLWSWDMYAEATIAAGTNGSVSSYMNSSGNAGFSGTVSAASFVYSSDARLKRDVKTIENPLDKIRALRGVSFSWKKDSKGDIGFIAQEVEKVEPRLVVDSDNGFKAVKYGNIVAIVVEAVKELFSHQKEMNQRLAKVEKENAELKQLLLNMKDELQIMKTRGPASKKMP